MRDFNITQREDIAHIVSSFRSVLRIYLFILAAHRVLTLSFYTEAALEAARVECGAHSGSTGPLRRRWHKRKHERFVKSSRYHSAMKHGVAFRKFSRTSSHRMLMLR